MSLEKAVYFTPIIVFIACYGIFKLQDKMYKRIDKRTKVTATKCPEKGTPLRDFELAYGHCIGCRFHEMCRGKIKKAYEQKPSA